jgi:large subunit ribosomal protein L25
MEEIVLEAELREETGRIKVKDLREKNFIPAVVYGEGKEAQAVKVAYRALLHLLHEHRLENVVVSLKIKDDKKKKSRPCLIKDIQHHPVKGDIIHVDFHEISLTKAIKVSVPVTVKGEAPGVKLEGGSLEHILWEIEIECLPTEMPEDISVDVSHLKLGGAVHIKDVVFPANIKVLNDPDSIIVSVAAPMKEEAPAEGVEGEEKKEPEVIKEKKEVPAEGKEAEAKEK